MLKSNLHNQVYSLSKNITVTAETQPIKKVEGWGLCESSIRKAILGKEMGDRNYHSILAILFRISLHHKVLKTSSKGKLIELSFNIYWR